MTDLSSFIKNNQKFFKLQDGESSICTYLGYSIGINRFDPEKEIANYKLKPLDSDRPIFWGCGRMDVAMAFNKIKPGTTVKISRSGTDKSNTSYKIEVHNGAVSSFDPDVLGDAQE
jgi:hypothetical protein